MSYQSISVHEAMDKLKSSEWVLPATQRPYVWGGRYDAESYIIKLFDSLFREYPIGVVIVWPTSSTVPYREFIGTYSDSETTKPIEDQGKWGNKKSLVYDGQQRLQTLYSCLNYTFNNKILTFDLLWKKDKIEDDIQSFGFKFRERNEELAWSEIRMNELFGKGSDQEIKFKKEILNRNIDRSNDLSDDDHENIETNLRQLWKIFVTEDKKSVSFFSIPSNSDTEVNEIFQRLNSSGVPLSQADLLLSRIKENSPDFEENLINASRVISGNSGFEIDQYIIIQIINLIVKGEVKLDASRVTTLEIPKFIDTWILLESAIQEFFVEFLGEQFKINHEAIIPSKRSLFPLIIYFFTIRKHGFNFKRHIHENSENLKKLKQFLIKSQINSWDLQRYVDKFTSIIFESAKTGFSNEDGTTTLLEFPLQQIEKYINEGKDRDTDIKEEKLNNKRLFVLKIIFFDKSYNFSPSKNRFAPEIDHIFPKKLKNQSSSFSNDVDTIWNLQPVRGEINGYKTNHNPVDFFNDRIKNAAGNLISGGKYFQEYDFVPEKESEEWQFPYMFINNRRTKMLNVLSEKYGLTVTSSNFSLDINHKLLSILN